MPKIGVVLTKDAINMLNDAPIKTLLRKGKIFNCESIKQNGYFLDMIISPSIPDLGKPLDPENNFILSIPIQFVLYIISGADDKILGF
jgi:hypothetical protein